MKSAITSVLLLTGVVSAIAIAEPVAEPKKIQVARGRFGFCGPAGVSCKRDAEPKKIQVARGRFGFCGPAGVSCKRDASNVENPAVARMKRSAEAIALAFAEASPDARFQGRFGFCGVAGASCHKARRSIEAVGELAERSYADIEERDAEADPKIQVAHGRFGFCGPAGVSCKRDAEAEAEADPKKIQVARGRFGFCGPAGVSCKRSAEPIAIAEAIQKARGRFGFCGPAGVSCKRDAEAEPMAIAEPGKFKAKSGRKGYQGRFGFCGVAGVSCAKVKRDAEINDIEARDPEAKKIQVARGRFGFCGPAGVSCKRDEDSAAVQDIAESIHSWDPTYLAEVCESEGGECAALRMAHKAFKQIKRDSEDEDYKRDVEKRSPEEEETEAQLDEIEEALDAAVADLE